MTTQSVSQSTLEQTISALTSEVVVCGLFRLLHTSGTFGPSKFAQPRRVKEDLLPSRVVVDWRVPSDGVCRHG
jgi:hypothetical protein